MIDHVILNVMSFEDSFRFYKAALAPLGYEVIWELAEGAGFGREGKPDFWVIEREPPHTRVHVAFACDDRSTVDAFHQAALEAGGTDNGPPGLREQYHPSYYGAFVLDPDDNNIEAVCHREEG